MFHFVFYRYGDHRHLHSFPTRRSSDLTLLRRRTGSGWRDGWRPRLSVGKPWAPPIADRKSTRLNSSHQIISYAVFCLKKKKTTLIQLSLTSYLPIRLSRSLQATTPQL